MIDIEHILKCLEKDYPDHILVVEPCFAEKRDGHCWCKTIIIPNFNNSGNVEYVIGSAELTTDEAIEIVRLHNRKVNIKKILE